MLLLAQALPPFPAEAVKSMVKAAQDPIVLGIFMTIVGIMAFAGAAIMSDDCSTLLLGHVFCEGHMPLDAVHFARIAAVIARRSTSPGLAQCSFVVTNATMVDRSVH